MIRKILLVLLVGLIVIQFIHPKKNQAAGEQPNYIGHRYAIPSDVKDIMVKACNDCHTNNTRYPWYTKLQPVHWWLDGHIRNGKKALNFDEYTHRNLRYQYHKMEEVIEMVKESKMPLKSYTWTHKDARLTADERAKITGWASAVMDTLEARYPPDSLRRKK
jgi:hypothetical protein